MKKFIYTCTWAFFFNEEKIHSHSVFSQFWGENILVGPGRKYMGPTIYFPSSLPNQIQFKKVFLLIFSPKFYIHPISPPNKHNLKAPNLLRPPSRKRFLNFNCRVPIWEVSFTVDVSEPKPNRTNTMNLVDERA